MIKTPVPLRWSDFDALRHVYNGQYQHFFDIGKSDYFLQIMGLSNDMAASGEGVITVATCNNYHATIELTDQIEVETSIEKIGTKSFTVIQQIVNPLTGELKADSRSVLVGFNPIDKTTFEIPEKWRKAIANHESTK